jgi:3-methylcrotonyl-CoA carboxylase beta subunit
MAKIAVMGGEQAAGVLADVRVTIAKRKGETLSEEEIQKIKQPILDQYEHESSPFYATARLWDDGIIDMTETRQALTLGIAMSMNKEIPDHNFGVFRM